jgi:hypothetical protein
LSDAKKLSRGGAHFVRLSLDAAGSERAGSTAAASKTTRSKFHNAMQDKFIEAVERALAAPTCWRSCQPPCSPDLEIELFLLTRDRTSDGRAPVGPEPDAV